MHSSFTHSRREDYNTQSMPTLSASQNLKAVIQKFAVKIPNMPKIAKVPKEITNPDFSSSINNMKASTTIDHRDLTKRNNSVGVLERKSHIIRTLKTEPVEQSDKLDLDDKFAVWEQVQKIKKVVEKYNYGGVQFPEILDLKKVIQCMDRINKQVSTQDTMMTELMRMVTKILTSAIYINPWIFEEFKASLNFIRNKDIESIRSRCYNENIPYFSLVRILLKEVVNLNDEGATKHNAHTERIEDLETVMQLKDSEISALKSKMAQMITKEQFIEKENELKELLQENDELRVEIEDYAKTKDELIQEKNVLMRKMDTMLKELNLMKNFQEHFTEDRKSADDEIAKLNEYIERLKASLNNYKDTFDKIIIRMSEIKIEIQELRTRYNNTLIENERLQVRAAAGFENLTPRPEYERIVKENFCFDFEFFDKKEKKSTVRTNQVIEQLMKNLHVLASMQSRPQTHDKPGVDSPKRRMSSMTSIRSVSPMENKRHSQLITSTHSTPIQKKSQPIHNSDPKKRMSTADASLKHPIVEENESPEAKKPEEKINLPIKLQKNGKKNSDYGMYVLKRADEVVKDAANLKKDMHIIEKEP